MVEIHSSWSDLIQFVHGSLYNNLKLIRKIPIHLSLIVQTKIQFVYKNKTAKILSFSFLSVDMF